MQLFEAKIQIVKYELPIEFRYGVLGKAEGDLFVVARLGGKLDFVQYAGMVTSRAYFSLISRPSSSWADFSPCIRIMCGLHFAMVLTQSRSWFCPAWAEKPLMV